MFGRGLHFYRELLTRRPYTTNIATSAALGCVGDLICQKTVEKVEKVDWRRNRSFVIFCALYQGGLSSTIYNWYSRAFSAARGFTPYKSAVAVTLFDNFVHVPMLYTPAFFGIVGTLQGQTPREVWKELSACYVETCVTCAVVWVPLTLINFGLIPHQYRILFVNAGCLVWNVLLDSMAGDKLQGDSGQAVAVKTIVDDAAAPERLSLSRGAASIRSIRRGKAPRCDLTDGII